MPFQPWELNPDLSKYDQDGGEPGEAYSPPELPCPNCHVAFFLQDDLERHLRSGCNFMSRGAKLSCHLCWDYSTYNYRDFCDHKALCPKPHGFQWFNCVCGARFRETLEGFRRHQEQVCPGLPPRRLMLCLRCGNFRSASFPDMDRHQRRCRGNYPQVRLATPPPRDGQDNE